MSNKLTKSLVHLFDSALTVALLQSELCAWPPRGSHTPVLKELLAAKGFLDPELEIRVQEKGKASLKAERKF